MACHHHHWIAHTDEQCRAWHARMAIGQHTQSDDVGLGMPSSPLGSTCGWMTSAVSCHLDPWNTHTVGQCRAWHAIIALGQHTRSDYVRRGMPSWTLSSTYGWKRLGVVGHHRRWTTYIGLDTSCVACYHRPFITHAIG